MKKPLDIYASLQTDITTIIMRRYYPDDLWHEWLSNDLPQTNKHWKSVLHKLYSVSPHQYGTGIDDTPLANKMGLTGEQLKQATLFLMNHDLISSDPSNAWRVTQKGFDVALRNEEIKNDNLIKRLLAICAIISLISIFI